MAFAVLCLLQHALPAAPSNILVPAYGNPCCGTGEPLWETLIASARPGVLEVILNPNSGPGTSPIDPNYIARNRQGPLLQLENAGATILGYVSTSWADRPLDEVLVDIDAYFSDDYYRGSEFSIDGIFIDEMSNDVAQLSYYQQIVQHVDSLSTGARMIGNPGTASVFDSSKGQSGNSIDDYAQVFDQLVVFENTSFSYRNQFGTPAWMNAYPPERFAHIVHSEGDVERMFTDLELASQRNVGTFFITDDLLPNPYDSIASYWDQLFAAVIPPLTINELTVAINGGSSNLNFDLNDDGFVNVGDRVAWLEQADTDFGDSNLDGRFDPSDLILVFQSGQYEDQISQNSRWEDGDWNGDFEFDSTDLIAAFSAGGYRSTAMKVPESNWHWLFLPLAIILFRKKK